MALRRFIQALTQPTADIRTSDGQAFGDTGAAASGANSVATNNGVLAAAATISFSTAAFTRATSGVVSVRGRLAVSASAAATLTATLLKDGVALAAAPTFIYATAAAQAGVIMSVDWIDVLADDNGHTYGIQVGASAGTVAAAANNGCMLLQETF